jgi:hypothetical protein
LLQGPEKKFRVAFLRILEFPEFPEVAAVGPGEDDVVELPVFAYCEVFY